MVQGPQEAVALGATCRYKNKYITTVFYKAPRPAAAQPPAQAAGATPADLSAERTMSF